MWRLSVHILALLKLLCNAGIWEDKQEVHEPRGAFLFARPGLSASFIFTGHQNSESSVEAGLISFLSAPHVAI